MLEAVSREYPDRVAIIDPNQEIHRTYAEMESRATQIANVLWSQGVRRGQNFGLLMHNCVDFLEVLYGAAKIGATVVLVNKRLTSEEMAYELRDSRSVGLVYSPKFDRSVEELDADLDESVWRLRSGPVETDLAPSFDSRVAEAPTSFETLTDVDLGEMGWVIIYTSGTTGRPKGVVLSQSNIVASNNNTKRFLWSRYGEELTPYVRAVVTAGLNHIGGLCTSAAPVLADAGTLVILDEFDAANTLRTIEKYKVNLAFSIGTMWNSIVQEDVDKYDLSSLRVIGTCIAQHTDEQLRVLHDGMGAEVYYMFGQTETTTGSVTTRRMSDLITRRGTLGKPEGYMDTRIVSDSGEPVPVGEVGELQYRGPTVFKEYYGRPAETEAAFQHGWFRSGDLVREDADGYLYFVDRLKDMVKTGGLNVFTLEVEQTILGYPGVESVAVTGIPDERWGEAVVAFVLTSEGAVRDAGAIVGHCRERLGHYKVPKRIIFTDHIPVNSLGKVLKRELVKSLTEAPMNGASPPSASVKARESALRATRRMPAIETSGSDRAGSR
ncbi:class I adenylate-forming enzyme family protein [Rhodococcus opacus]